MMLEGKVSFDPAALANLPSALASPPGSANNIQNSSGAIQEKIVYKERENKENSEL
jgi:hypothetical protein